MSVEKFDNPPDDSKDKTSNLTDRGKNAMRGTPLSQEHEMKINEIRQMPVEKRQAAMGEYFSSLSDSEKKKIQESGGPIRRGKGISVTGGDGSEIILNYEEDDTSGADGA